MNPQEWRTRTGKLGGREVDEKGAAIRSNKTLRSVSSAETQWVLRASLLA